MSFLVTFSILSCSEPSIFDSTRLACLPPVRYPQNGVRYEQMKVECWDHFLSAESQVVIAMRPTWKWMIVSRLNLGLWRNKRTKPLLLSDGEFTAFHWGKRASSCGLLVCILRFLHRELGGKVSQFMEEMDLIGLLTADALAHRSNYGIGIPIPAIL